jgi:hypothetical protein
VGGWPLRQESQLSGPLLVDLRDSARPPSTVRGMDWVIHLCTATGTAPNPAPQFSTSTTVGIVSPLASVISSAAVPTRAPAVSTAGSVHG